MVGSTTTSYGYNSVGDPTTVGSATQVFDAAGQLCWTTTSTVSSPSCGSPASGATTYTNNGDGQRTAETPATGIAADYTYNGDGLRATKTVGSSTTTFTYDTAGKVPLLLTDGSNDYVYGPAGVPVEQFNTGGTNALYDFSDAHGSTVALTNVSGVVSATYTYSAWGSTIGQTGAASTPIQFAGAYVDAETGFLYLQARFYDPATALFLTVDPLVEQTLQAYLYAGDNPLNVLDPLGESWWNPSTWSSQTWNTISTVGIIVGAVALAATGVGAIADGVALGIDAAAGTATALGDTAGTIGTVADITGVVLGTASAVDDGLQCLAKTTETDAQEWSSARLASASVRPASELQRKVKKDSGSELVSAAFGTQESDGVLTTASSIMRSIRNAALN